MEEGSQRGGSAKEEGGRGGGREAEADEVDDEWEAGREEDEPATPLEGPSGVGAHMQWAEWEQEQQLQAEAHEIAVLAFERMAEAAEWMEEAMEQILKQTANKWGLYHAWAEWAEMRRREDACEARVAEFECTGGGWKRSQLVAVEEKFEEADEGAEGDNKEEEEVRGEQEGGEEQEGGGEQVMEE
ncbi:hypothetical protein M404DRAFT_32557 [Pisolithus tinctorius Marx 270]|uniref:Uncharacterized protein n=1 Tax=Pisolithus tinctorius Marx 270 TaxID=870435 RepID=A0A0C3NNL1_PISTI|nr:hypothetical protein M404DRAFT_32557 [Pisolithus tinctorius Marx 270]